MNNSIISWVKFSADNRLKYWNIFSQEIGFDISCKLSPIYIHFLKQLTFFFILKIKLSTNVYQLANYELKLWKGLDDIKTLTQNLNISGYQRLCKHLW